MHRAVLGDTPDIVAAQIYEHAVLGKLFLIGAQRPGERGVLLRRGAARARARDRPHRDLVAFHAHQHLR